MTVRAILDTKGHHILTVEPEAKLSAAVKILGERKIGAVLVMSNGGVEGILSERDIVREAARDEKFFVRVVADLMTRDVITGQPHDDLLSVAHTMTERRIRHLPVVDKGRLIGMVSIGDVVKAQRDHYQGEVDTLQTQLLADERGRAR